MNLQVDVLRRCFGARKLEGFKCSDLWFRGLGFPNAELIRRKQFNLSYQNLLFVVPYKF